MHEQNPLIESLLVEATKREKASFKKEKIVNRIVDKLGTFLTERGGWNPGNNKISDIGTFPMFDGDESSDLYFRVNIGFENNTKSVSPDSIRVKVYKDGSPQNEKTLLSVTQGKNMGPQVFKIEDQLGREINKIADLRKMEKLIGRILVYGRKNIYPIDKSASTR